MPSFSSALLPTSTGLALGSPSLRWTAYLQNLDVVGSITSSGTLISGGTITNVTYSTTLVFNASASASFEVTLTGNVTGSTIASPTTGAYYCFILVQDAIGGHTFTWPVNVIGASSIDTAANKINIQVFICRSNGNLYPITLMSVI